MYSSTFIFRAGQYDKAFHELDQWIAEVARAIRGYRRAGWHVFQKADARIGRAVVDRRARV
jgi:hypothetical protein